MTSSVKTVPTGFCVSYPKTNWQVNFVEDAAGKFRFYLTGQKVRFERTSHDFENHTTIKLSFEEFVSTRVNKHNSILAILSVTNYSNTEVTLICNLLCSIAQYER